MTLPASPDWIAVDWGTSSLRAWAMSGRSEVLAQARSDLGMGRLTPDGFEPALLALAGDWLGSKTIEVVVCGMAGARQGWREAAYRPVPCPPLGPEVVRFAGADPRLAVTILPGLSQAAPADVMRGEETQIAGFLAQTPGFDGVLCLPGTHTKWVQISAGEVVGFRTCMTGELFALLSGQSVLRHALSSDGFDEDAFVAALADAISAPQQFTARLFEIRARSLLEGLPSAAARARLSGLLIGLELAATRPYWLGQEIAIIGDGRLAARYGQALAAQGAPSRVADAEAVTLAGLVAGRDLARTAPEARP